MFRLTATEKTEVVANCDHLSQLKFSPQRPYAFTEHGAIMAATILNSRFTTEERKAKSGLKESRRPSRRN
jgi:hypothetical protein